MNNCNFVKSLPSALYLLRVPAIDGGVEQKFSHLITVVILRQPWDGEGGSGGAWGSENYQSIAFVCRLLINSKLFQSLCSSVDNRNCRWIFVSVAQSRKIIGKKKSFTKEGKGKIMENWDFETRLEGTGKYLFENKILIELCKNWKWIFHERAILSRREINSMKIFSTCRLTWRVVLNSLSFLHIASSRKLIYVTWFTNS